MKQISKKKESESGGGQRQTRSAKVDGEFIPSSFFGQCTDLQILFPSGIPLFLLLSYN